MRDTRRQTCTCEIQETDVYVRDTGDRRVHERYRERDVYLRDTGRQMCT